MCGSLLSVNVLLHDAILIDTKRCKQIKRALVARVNTIKDQTDNNLLPCWTALVPELGLLEVNNIADILHNTVHGTRCQHFILIVRRDGNKQLSVSVVHSWSEIVAIFEGEIIRIAIRCSVCISSSAGAMESPTPSEQKPTSHMSELLGASFKVISILCLHSILNRTWHRIIRTQDGAVRQLDLTGHPTLQRTSIAHSATAWLLSRAPVLHRAGLAAIIRAAQSWRHIVSSRIYVSPWSGPVAAGLAAVGSVSCV